MEVINKNHSSILFNKRLEKVAYINFYNENEIHFSSCAVRDLKIRIGSYVHFINEDDEWFFYINNDKDGFCVQDSNRRNNVSIYNGSLIKLFMKRTGRTWPVKYPLKETKMEQHESMVFKIEINKPIE